MEPNGDARAQRVRLMEQHLHELEEVDGVFDVSMDCVVAVTSERLVIVRGGGPHGWAQTSIPWRVVTTVQLTPGEAGEMMTVAVEYNRPLLRRNRNGVDVVTSVRAFLAPETPEEARRMSILMDLRRAAAV